MPGSGRTLSVVWTRGKGCAELAALLDDGEPSRIGGDLTDECVEARADLLVSRRFPGSFELVNVAVPVDFEPENVTKVVSAVAGGPHSTLAATTGALLADRLDVEAEMISAARPGEGVQEGSLLVIGAPGGSWLQRARFGPGARLRSKAQAGAVVVRSAPDRVFQHMGEPVFVGPLRHADDTLRIHEEGVLAVADEGLLVGLVRREHLATAGDAVVGTVMEEAVSAKVDETVSDARIHEEIFGDDPIPVTDHEEHLVGALSLPSA